MEINERQPSLPDGGCKKRFGEVDITLKKSQELEFHGTRKDAVDCVKPSGKIKNIEWHSLVAFFSPNSEKIFIHYITGDSPPRHGFIDDGFIKARKEDTPTRIEGNLMYLIETDKKQEWFRGKFYFYKRGTKEAEDIAKKLPKDTNPKLP